MSETARRNAQFLFEHMIKVLNIGVARRVAYFVHFHIGAQQQLLCAFYPQIVQISDERTAAFLCKARAEILLVEADVIGDGFQCKFGIGKIILHKFLSAFNVTFLLFTSVFRT